MTPIHISFEFAWVFNFVLFAGAIAIAFAVGRHARRQKDYSVRDSVLWALLVLFTFPIGLILYLVLSRNQTTSPAADN